VVDFGSVPATGVSVHAGGTQLTATSPAESAGTVDVTVTTPGGTSATSSADQFTYVAPSSGGTAPVVSSVSPNSGPQAGDSQVTISGSGFTGVTGVDFGSQPALSYTTLNASTIEAVSPPGTGTVDVTVIAPTGTSAISAADQFTYVGAPVVSSLTPSSGPAAGGTSVTIDGSNLVDVLAVFFGNNQSTDVQSISSTELIAVTPPGSGTVSVEVVTADGASTTSSASQFTYTAGPAVTSVSPSSGASGGGTLVTISGSGFTGTVTVHFGDQEATNVMVVSATEITADSPPGEGTVDVTVTTAAGTSSTSPADQFTYQQLPAVVSVSPQSGPATGGNQVNIFGSGFTGASQVEFGTSDATSFSVVNDNEITAIAPAGTGTVDVRVIGAGGTSPTSAADRYTYAPGPKVSLVFPNSGPADQGFKLVFILGQDLTGATSVTFGNVSAPFAEFSSVVILAFAPPEPPGTVDVRVSTSSGGTSPSTSGDEFTYTSSSGTAGGTSVSS